MYGKKSKEELWVSNISNTDVSLSDLGITIQKYTTVDLFNFKKYPFLNKQLVIQSIQTGSISKRPNKLIIRLLPPEKKKIKNLPVSDKPLTGSLYQKNAVKVDKEVFEELDLPDEVYAEENADFAEFDRNKK